MDQDKVGPLIRVMTFNIRYREGDQGRHRWARRRAQVVARIRVFNPDLLGIQECSAGSQAGYLRQQLRDWQFESVPSGDAAWPVETAPALWKTDAFERLSSGHFWLSETPDVPGSRSGGAAFARTVTWVELIERATGRRLTFANAHFDYDPTANAYAAGVLQEWAAHVHSPLLVTGDFNADKQSIAYRTLRANGFLSDVYASAHPNEQPPRDGTFHDYGDQNAPEPLDWILASADFEAITAGVDTTSAPHAPSDHYPLTAVVRWRRDR